MCKGEPRPQRRHRAMYLAPSALHLPQPEPTQAIETSNDDGLRIPLLLEVPISAPMTVSPPSSGELSPVEIQTAYTPPRNWKQQLRDAGMGMVHGMADLGLLLCICIMGCFFYDVEVEVVKADRRRRGRHRGRVVLQTNRNYQRGPATSLLRTPPRSGTFSRSTQSLSPLDDVDWENMV